jgi:hypothetical protein
MNGQVPADFDNAAFAHRLYRKSGAEATAD